MDKLTRRTFVVGGAGAAALLLLGAGAKLQYVYGSQTLLRPPGGQNEERFLSLCIKCDRCRSACPLDCISVANLHDGLLNARTPKLDFKLGYCDFCNLCIKNCPTGALEYFDPETEWISPAVIETELCIAYQPEGLGCRKCIDICPFEAITTDELGRPLVITENCNGCGYCEHICPSNSYRAFSGVHKRAITVEQSNQPRTLHSAIEGGSY